MFRVVASVFGEEARQLPDAWVDRVIAREDFWAFGAYDGDACVCGLTAHTLPMTRGAYSEIFIYDIAVHEEHQRKGIGRALVAALREEAAAAGTTDLFVAADNEDSHALDFYRALGGEAAPVTMFSFGS
jgi:aminoglycoside 3-N-acetyltransferase I